MKNLTLFKKIVFWSFIVLFVSTICLIVSYIANFELGVSLSIIIGLANNVVLLGLLIYHIIQIHKMS